MTRARIVFALLAALLLTLLGGWYAAFKPVSSIVFTPTSASLGALKIGGDAKVDGFDRIVPASLQPGHTMGGVYLTMTFDLPSGGEYILLADYTGTQKDTRATVMAVHLPVQFDSYSEMVMEPEIASGAGHADPAKPAHAAVARPNLVLRRGHNKVVVKCATTDVMSTCPLFHRFRFERVYTVPGVY